MKSIRFEGHVTLTFRQLDILNGAPKGTAFRRFRALGDRLQEGRDFFYLAPDEHGEFIERLRFERLTYPGTPHVVLITESGYRRMQSTEADF